MLRVFHIKSTIEAKSTTSHESWIFDFLAGGGSVSGSDVERKVPSIPQDFVSIVLGHSSGKRYRLGQSRACAPDLGWPPHRVPA
jgi:hypothetical protein